MPFSVRQNHFFGFQEFQLNNQPWHPSSPGPTGPLFGVKALMWTWYGPFNSFSVAGRCSWVKNWKALHWRALVCLYVLGPFSSMFTSWIQRQSYRTGKAGNCLGPLVLFWEGPLKAETNSMKISNLKKQNSPKGGLLAFPCLGPSQSFGVQVDHFTLGVPVP